MPQIPRQYLALCRSPALPPGPTFINSSDLPTRTFIDRWQTLEMTATTGFGVAAIVLVVLASVSGLCILAVSVLRRVANQLGDDVRTPSTTTIHELMGRDQADRPSTTHNGPSTDGPRPPMPLPDQTNA